MIVVGHGESPPLVLASDIHDINLHRPIAVIRLNAEVGNSRLQYSVLDNVARAAERDALTSLRSKNKLDGMKAASKSKWSL